MHEVLVVFAGFETQQGKFETVLPLALAMAPTAIAPVFGHDRHHVIGEVQRSVGRGAFHDDRGCGLGSILAGGEGRGTIPERGGPAARGDTQKALWFYFPGNGTRGIALPAGGIGGGHEKLQHSIGSGEESWRAYRGTVVNLQPCRSGGGGPCGCQQ